MRNYQARNFMRSMQVGDGVLFYHSSCAVPGIDGLADRGQRGLSGPDPVRPEIRLLRPQEHARRSALGRWSTSRFERKLSAPIALDEIKRHADALGEEFALIRRGSRLSVLPVTAAQWKFLLSLE